MIFIIKEVMDLSKIDFTKKENQTFKNWFKVMWSNTYILPFVGALAFFIGLIVTYTDELTWYLVLLLPITMMGVIGYKGFYQFWDDLKKGKTR